MNNAPQELSHAKVSSEPVCGDCVYARPGPNTKDNVLSRSCFFHPPTALTAAIPGRGLAIMSVRPEVQTDTWACGQFKSRLS